MSILVVDNDPILLEQLSSALKKENYTVNTAADGRQGLNKIWNNPYDLILLDITLPHIGGLEVLKEMRAAGLETPAIILAKKGGIDDKVTGLDFGADDYLVKPFSLHELLARVRALLRRAVAANPIVPQQVFLSRLNSFMEVMSNGGSMKNYEHINY